MASGDEAKRFVILFMLFIVAGYVLLGLTGSVCRGMQNSSATEISTNGFTGDYKIVPIGSEGDILRISTFYSGIERKNLLASKSLEYDFLHKLVTSNYRKNSDCVRYVNFQELNSMYEKRIPIDVDTYLLTGRDLDSTTVFQDIRTLCEYHTYDTFIMKLNELSEKFIKSPTVIPNVDKNKVFKVELFHYASTDLSIQSANTIYAIGTEPKEMYQKSFPIDNCTSFSRVAIVIVLISIFFTEIMTRMGLQISF